MKGTIQHYSEKASHYYSLYNSVEAENVHNDWKSFLQTTSPGKALDVGAGSGRDANWLAQQGWQVVAVEPADELRKLAASSSHKDVTWSNSSLPYLSELSHQEEAFKLILLSAVWMHIPINERPAALKTLSELLSQNGYMYISLRFGPSDDNRPMYPVSYDELQTLARDCGLTTRNLNSIPSKDRLSRQEVEWVTVELAREVKA